MHFSNVNLLSVLAAGIATMILGFVWYSPALFAKPWMREMGYDLNDKAKLKEMQKSAGATYGIAFLAGLVSAFMLAKILSITPIDTALYGMKLGLGVWLGFVATVQLTGASRLIQAISSFATSSWEQSSRSGSSGALLQLRDGTDTSDRQRLASGWRNGHTPPMVFRLGFRSPCREAK